MINLVCHYGSTGKICDEVADYVIKHGGEALVCSVNGLFDQCYHYKYELKSEAFIKKVYNKLAGEESYRPLLQTKRLLKKINEYQPDIIHIHNIHHRVVDFKMLFDQLSKMNIPIVYTLHDMWAMTGGCYCKWDCKKLLCKECSMKQGDDADCSGKIAEIKLQEKINAYKMQKKIVFTVPSEYLEDEARNGILADYRIFKIANGLNIEQFKKKSDHSGVLDNYHGKKVLSCAAYWMERKGLYDFYKLADLLGEDYQIILVGYCDKSLQVEKDNITFMNQIDSPEKLAELYSSADIYVSLSWSETFGMTIAEAACCGCRVAAYDNTGMGEVVTAAGGIAVPNRDINKMAEVIKKVCNDKQAVTKETLDRVRATFSEKRMCSEFYNLYESILQGDTE